MPSRHLLHAALLASTIAGIVTGCSSGDAGNGTGTSGSAGTPAAGTAGNATAGSSNQAGSGNVSGGGLGGSNGGQNGAGASNGGSSAGNGTGGNAMGGNAMGGSAAGGMSNGAPSATDLLAKLGDCKPLQGVGPFNPDDGSPEQINVCQTGSVVWWKADMDVDCDGIQTPPCNTDNTGQPMTSIVDLAPTGDVDPTKLPYFVIPLGEPQTEWYTKFGIDLGQVGAIIYKNQVFYGIFADQAGGNFIGEASYDMCGLFIGTQNCDPNMGGIDPLDVTYLTFTGNNTRAMGKDIYDHDKQTQMGEAAAKLWLTQ